MRESVNGYDYSSRERREETISRLWARAKSARGAVEADWRKYNDYYNGNHFINTEDENFLPSIVQDAFISVESQIDPNVPEPQFTGRDDDMDDSKAKQREKAVRYVCENNRLTDMNTRNERRLLKYGDAFWKAYWDGSMRCGVHEGDIRVTDVPVDCIFPDPSIRNGDIQKGQYLDYVYRIHKVEAMRLYGKEMKKAGMEPETLLNIDFTSAAGTIDITAAVDDNDDTVEVLEHWFKQPVQTKAKGKTVPAGAVGCVILIGYHEMRYIPDYWERTNWQNQLFPFVQYWRIQDENRIWNKSELFALIGIIDDADRTLTNAKLQDGYNANDILLVEEGALADGEEISNEPGSIVRIKQGRNSSIRRLGGTNKGAEIMANMEYYRSEIERTSRNWMTNQGKTDSANRTATGIAMIRADAEQQTDVKSRDRRLGFERLYELIDWLCLEFFDDDRMLYIGADEANDRPKESFQYNAGQFVTMQPAVYNEMGVMVREPWEYFPRLDVTVSAGNGIAKSKQATLETLQALAAMQITPENYKLIAKQLELIDLPGRHDIEKEWEERFMLQQTIPVQPVTVPQGEQTIGGIDDGGLL